MPEFFFTATDESGRKVTDSIEAESAAEAGRLLRAEGCQDVVLHTDDVMASVVNIPANVRKTFGPREMIKLGRMRFPEYVLFVLRRFYLSVWWIMAADLGWLAWRRWYEDPWSGLDWMLVALPLMPALILPLVLWLGSSRKYFRLLQSIVIADWEDTLERVERLKPDLPINEYAYRKAQARIGLGDTEEGLALFRRLEYTGDIPDWLYWCLLGELLVLAKRLDQALAALSKAVELAPSNPTVLLSLADTLLTYRRDAVEGRHFLERAKQFPISDLTQWALWEVEGMVALETGDPQSARKHLQDAMKWAALLRGNGLYPLVVAKIDTFLCLACAAAGDPTAAERHFARAEPLLVAHRKDELLERCRQALAGTRGVPS